MNLGWFAADFTMYALQSMIEASAWSGSPTVGGYSENRVPGVQLDTNSLIMAEVSNKKSKTFSSSYRVVEI